MKTVSKVALANLKYSRTRNLLVGIAVFLVSLMLFAVPSIGKCIIDSQFASVNELYPTWHALFRNVDENTVKMLTAHYDIDEYGLRSDVAQMAVGNADISMMYLDEAGREMYKVQLESGTYPEEEGEIVVSKGLLEAAGISGGNGDTIRLPYQVIRNSGLDYTEERDFKICGFLPDTVQDEDTLSYTALVSEKFMRSEVPAQDISYRFLFRVFGNGDSTTDELEQKIKDIASGFGISEKDMKINGEYLSANYVDPVFLPSIVVIMSIIVVAGIVTIYSIYYVSMAPRVREFGRLKALGASKKQIKKIVVREGMFTALIFVPAGLAAGTLATKVLINVFLGILNDDNVMVETARALINNGSVPLYHWWIYLIAAAASFFTIFLSLRKPVKTASKASAVEAMNYSDGNRRSRKSIKGYENMTVGRLAARNLLQSRKKSIITIAAMSITGIFLMCVASVLACADPADSAAEDVPGQYKVVIQTETGNAEHPEREWNAVIRSNPIDSELVSSIEALDGVEKAEIFSQMRFDSDFITDGSSEWICGIPESYKKEIEDGIIEGSASYDDLKSGDKAILDSASLHWYPDLAVGDKVIIRTDDGETTAEREVEIIAIGEYSMGITGYSAFIMSKEAVDTMSTGSLNDVVHIYADEMYDAELEADIRSLMEESDVLRLVSRQEKYEEWKMSMTVVTAACSVFLGILGAICIMNLINTMIYSVHVRKKELGMMQAVGMSSGQLRNMLSLEGLFYTVGTLILTVGAGSLLGYPVFLWAKKNSMFNISTYHYPWEAALIVTVVLAAVQFVLVFALGKYLNRDTLINRIRFSE